MLGMRRADTDGTESTGRCTDPSGEIPPEASAMATDEFPSRPDAESTAQRAADRLALALEEIGFDVGVTFPELHGRSERSGTATVLLGSVTPVVAADLAAILTDAANLGLALLPR
jgi:hypothetical protein